jgi:CBS domain-containing protein
MKELFVKDLMVPLEEYATIHQDATLYDAVLALEEAQAAFEKSNPAYRHRAVLVYDESGTIVGKLSQLDLLKGLEPKYNEAAAESGRMMTSGFSRSFLRSLIQQFALWDKPLADVCKKAAKLHVKDCMYIPEEGEYVDADDSLDVAIHQLVLGRHQSLLVVKNSEIVGILRLTDVFREVANTIKACNI